MKHNNQKYQIITILGLTLFVIGVSLALFANYNHYYEIMMAGVMLTLLRFIPKSTFSIVQYSYLYLVLMVAGVLGDLVMGLWVTELWSYSFNTLSEYFVTYIFLYPIAGSVMVQSFIICKNLLFKPKAKEPQPSPSKHIPWIMLFGLGTVIALYFTLSGNNVFVRLGFYASLSLLAFTGLDYFALLTRKESLLNDLRKHPWGIIGSVLLVSYLQFSLQEITNLYGKQWLYETKGMESLVIFGSISMPVFLLWPLLLILPVAAYYTVHPSNPFFRLFQSTFYRKRQF